MRGHEEPEKENGERWLLTYSDLITLLLAFFIILYSMSNLDKEKFKAVIESLGSVFGMTQGTSTAGDGSGGDINFPAFSPSSSTMPTVFPSALPSGASASPGPTPMATSSPDNGGIGNAIDIETQAMEDVQKQVQGLLDDKKLQSDVTVSIRQRGLVISINSRVLFRSGSAELTAESRALVKRIANILTPLANNQICVEGHTDTDPIHTAQFQSNWELSSDRANMVLRLLLENRNLKPEKLSSMGYGEFRPIARNDTPANKAKNRRVNIVILKDEFNKSIDISPKD